MALDCTGEAYRELGQPDEAAKFHTTAARIHAELDDDWQQATARYHLGLALADLGRREDADRAISAAVALLERFPDPRAVTLRSRLRSLPHGTP
jgi:hypothetical protein